MRTVQRKGVTFAQNTSRIGKSAARPRPSKPTTDGAAFKPVLGHSNPPPMVPLSLPLKNPQMAAKALIELFDDDWLTVLCQEIANHLKSGNSTREGSSNDDHDAAV
jgi:hypothetical protein